MIKLKMRLKVEKPKNLMILIWHMTFP